MVRVAAVALAAYLSLVLADMVLRLGPANVHRTRHGNNIAAAARAGIPFDERTGWEVIADLRADGREAYPFVTPATFLRGELARPVIGGREVLPLGGISGVTTVACNETGTWMVYDADQHGFNNPPGMYDGTPAVVAVGDSFTHGTCMPRGREFVSLLREEYGSALGLGTYGSGPLLVLAQTREYAAWVRPPVVLWFYFEGNDVVSDVAREMRDPILRRYLEPDFRQGLLPRQRQIDRHLKGMVGPPDDAGRQGGATWGQAVAAVLSLKDVRVLGAKAIGRVVRYDKFRSRWFDEQYAQNLVWFDEAVAVAKADVERWGGELVVVYLPSWEAFHAPWHDGVALKPRVLEVVERHGVPVIDVDPAFRSLDVPADAFALSLPNHYGELGNRLVAETVIDGLRTIRSDPATAGSGPGSSSPAGYR